MKVVKIKKDSSGENINACIKFTQNKESVNSNTEKSYFFTKFTGTMSYCWEFIKMGNVYWTGNYLFNNFVWKKETADYLCNKIGIPCFIVKILEIALHSGCLYVVKSIVYSQFYADLLSYLKGDINDDKKLKISGQKLIKDYFSIKQISKFSWTGFCRGSEKIGASFLSKFIMDYTALTIPSTFIIEFIKYTRENETSTKSANDKLSLTFWAFITAVKNVTYKECCKTYGQYQFNILSKLFFKETPVTFQPVCYSEFTPWSCSKNQSPNILCPITFPRMSKQFSKALVLYEEKVAPQLPSYFSLKLNPFEIYGWFFNFSDQVEK